MKVRTKSQLVGFPTVAFQRKTSEMVESAIDTQETDLLCLYSFMVVFFDQQLSQQKSSHILSHFMSISQELT